MNGIGFYCRVFVVFHLLEYSHPLRHIPIGSARNEAKESTRASLAAFLESILELPSSRNVFSVSLHVVFSCANDWPHILHKHSAQQFGQFSRQG